MSDKDTILNVETVKKMLEEKGYKVTIESDETPTETATKEPEKTPETPEKTPDRTQPEPPKETQIRFVMGTPTETPQNDTLTEEKIMLMTPEQIQENMPKIRDYVLDQGGQF